MEKAAHFCSICTLCGKCSEICPVKIPIHNLILENKKDLVRENKFLLSERFLFNMMFKKMKSRKSLDKHKSSLKNFELKQYIKNTWRLRREIPIFAEQSFSQYWKELNNIDVK